MSATPPETYAAATADDFLDRILSTPSYTDDGRGGTLLNDERFVETTSSMVSSQLSSGDGAAVFTGNGSTFPLDLSLGVQFPNARVVSGRGSLVNSEGQFVPLANLLPQAGHIYHHPVQQTDPHVHQVFHGQTFSGAVGAAQNSPGIRPKVRARRGQATDPHSIAERLRRERITERVKALQEIVPSCNKTDRAAMLDEVLDYVKFLRLQVKVLSMSRLGGAGAVAQLVTENPEVSAQGDAIEDGIHQQVWEKWSNDGTEQEVARLMEKDIGAAMQFLQSKALCIMPISLAAAVFPSPQLDVSGHVKPELNAP